MNTMPDGEFRLICHSCGNRYPANTAISVSKADCCRKPKVHVHDVDDEIDVKGDGVLIKENS